MGKPSMLTSLSTTRFGSLKLCEPCITANRNTHVAVDFNNWSYMEAASTSKEKGYKPLAFVLNKLVIGLLKIIAITPLHYAVLIGNHDLIKTLIQKGVNINKKAIWVL
jgi:hypothetical protein